MILVMIFGFIMMIYGLIITMAMWGWGQLNYFMPNPKVTPKTRVTIIIPAKNEEENIEFCLKELLSQDYPQDLIEMIVIDDASEDETALRVRNLLAGSKIKTKFIKKNQHVGKKRALAEAIELANGELIITSDADMFGRHSAWLREMVLYYEWKRPEMIVLPIAFSKGSSFLARFQWLENVALTGITAGFAGIKKPFMCNGANLAFTKKAFEQVNGYTEHIHLASGEDVFLLESIKKMFGAGAIQYLVSRKALAYTRYVRDWKDFYHQRLRWAYKAKYNSNVANAFIGFIVVAANLIFPALFVGMLEKSPLISYLSIFAVSKVVFDFLLLFLASDFLGARLVLLFLIPFEFVYWIYATIIGLSSIVVKPKWKNKRID